MRHCVHGKPGRPENRGFPGQHEARFVPRRRSIATLGDDAGKLRGIVPCRRAALRASPNSLQRQVRAGTAACSRARGRTASPERVTITHQATKLQAISQIRAAAALVAWTSLPAAHKPLSICSDISPGPSPQAAAAEFAAATNGAKRLLLESAGGGKTLVFCLVSHPILPPFSQLPPVRPSGFRAWRLWRRLTRQRPRGKVCVA